MADSEMVQRFIVTVENGTPIGLYTTARMAEAIAQEVDGTVYYIDAIAKCQAQLVFIARYEDRKKFNTED